MEKILEEFNKKWSNKKVIQCPYMFSNIRIATNKVYYSCNCISNISNFPFFQEVSSSFSFEDYIKNLDLLLTANKETTGLCCKCIHSEENIINPLNKNNITQVTLDYFKTCNCNCSYYCYIKCLE